MTPPRLKFLGGDPALDLVNTVDWTTAGPRAERLPTYERVTEWAEGAGVLPSRNAGRLRQVARRRPRGAADALRKAHQTRDTLYRVLAARARGRRPAPRDLVAFNRLLADALERLELRSGPGGDAVLGWRGLGEALESPLWPVVWSAARLLSSPEADRIRICGGDDCGWMYVDRSRNGFRRWCEMATCGTRAKNRRRSGSRPRSRASVRSTPS